MTARGWLALALFSGCTPAASSDITAQTAAVQIGSAVDGTIDSAIVAAFARLGGQSALGAPADNGGGVNVHRLMSANVQDFDGGTLGKAIIIHGDGQPDAWVVRSGFWAYVYYPSFATVAGRWQSWMGLPLEDEHATATGAQQRFEHGYAVWSTGANTGWAMPGAPLDVLDPYAASCDGNPMTASDARTHFANGGTHAALGAYAVYTRTRSCTLATQCTDWSAPTLQRQGKTHLGLDDGTDFTLILDDAVPGCPNIVSTGCGVIAGASQQSCGAYRIQTVCASGASYWNLNGPNQGGSSSAYLSGTIKPTCGRLEQTLHFGDDDEWDEVDVLAVLAH